MYTSRCNITFEEFAVVLQLPQLPMEAPCLAPTALVPITINDSNELK